MLDEVWKTLKYNGVIYNRYSVSNFGRIKSNITGTIYKQHKDHNGYNRFSIYLGYKDGKIINKNIAIHKAVAEVFIPNPNNLPVVNHKDGIKSNNYYTNLEWCTIRENSIHARDTGLLHNVGISGTKNVNSKLSKEQVNYIRSVYIPKHKLYGARALGKHFGVSHSTISLVVCQKTYRND